MPRLTLAAHRISGLSFLSESLRRSIYGLSRLKTNVLGGMFLSVGAAERHCRHYFFYNAFRALKFNGIDGDYAEFGVSGANTFALADAERTRHGLEMKLWAFDSFRGLPAANGSKDEHPEWVEGSMATSLDAFHRKCARRGIERSSYETVVGFYEDSLSERDGRRFPSNLALAYVDCDLHSSTTAVLAFLAPRLKHGMIVAFDDYFCWSAGQLSGERKALLEFEAGARQWHFQPFIQYGWGGMSFVIEDRNLIPRSKDHAAA